MQATLGKWNNMIHMMRNACLFADALAFLVDHNYFFFLHFTQSRNIHQGFSSSLFCVEDCFAFLCIGIVSSCSFSFLAETVLVLRCFFAGSSSRRKNPFFPVFSLILSPLLNTTQTSTAFFVRCSPSILWIHTFGHGNLSPVFSLVGMTVLTRHFYLWKSVV